MRLLNVLSLGFICLTVVACQSTGGSTENLFESPLAKAGPEVVSVNGTAIHQGLLDLLAQMNPRIKSQLESPVARQKILASMVDQQLLYQKAVDSGLAKDEMVHLKSLLNKNILVANAYLDAELEKAMQSAYEERKEKDFVKIRLALIATHFKTEKTKGKPTEVTPEEKAQAKTRIEALQARLHKGDAFDVVAKEGSDDKITKSKGGDAGLVGRADKRFARLGLDKMLESAFSLKKEQLTDIIEGAEGYYLAKVLDEPTAVPYAEAERTLRFELQSTVKEKLLADLRQGAKIKYADGSKPVTTSTTEPDAPSENAKGNVISGSPQTLIQNMQNQIEKKALETKAKQDVTKENK